MTGNSLFLQNSGHWAPLLEYRRAGLSEVVVHGAVAWASGGKLFHMTGDNALLYGRSLMKPVMAKPLVKALDKITTVSQKALVVASHNGSRQHVQLAKSILPKSKWHMMGTPPSLPLQQSLQQRSGKVKALRRWYNCCSGEHAGILLGCEVLGWQASSYLSPHHPFFQAYLNQLKHYLGATWEPITVAQDGCGLPTLSNTLEELAIVYASLVKEKADDWIWNSMVSYPVLVGGEGRLDSAILLAGGGKVLAKEGADGLLGLAIDHSQFPEGLGIVIKISHGWNPQATWFLAAAILGVLGVHLPQPASPAGQQVFLSETIVPLAYRSLLAQMLKR